MILQPVEIENTVLGWLPRMRRSVLIIYWVVAALLLAVLISLYFIQVDITVRATGFIRPANERTYITSPVTGVIDSLYFKEGDPVVKKTTILTIRDVPLLEKRKQNEAEIYRYKTFIHDLKFLTSGKINVVNRIPLLISPLYKQEALRFFSRISEHQVLLLKARHETELNEQLAKDKVISPKEFYDIRIQEQKVVSAFETSRGEQLAEWQAGLVKCETELKQCIIQQEEIRKLYEAERICAPVSGSLQELGGRYPGSSIQSGELICSISPGGDLVAECFVATKDIGMIRKGQAVRFQIDAFNYNYFGVVTGNIYAIDNDFILSDKKPFFKVRCKLNERVLKLSNGYTGEIKKGMGFQARFITCRRTLWQLLYDGLNDWLNPAGS